MSDMSWLDTPDDWYYKAEGNAHIVLGYRGSNTQWQGKIVRITKTVDTKKDSHQASDSNVYPSDTLLDLARGEVWLRERIIGSCLGSDVVPTHKPFLIGSDSLQVIDNVILRPGARPTSRIRSHPSLVSGAVLCSDKNGSVKQGERVLPASLMPDLSFHPAWKNGLNLSTIVCYELKPKCGVIYTCGKGVHCRNIRHQVCIYCSHQRYKCDNARSDGEACVCSTYCPIDLFSQDTQRVDRALASLFTSPKNNLRLFADGEPLTAPSASVYASPLRDVLCQDNRVTQVLRGLKALQAASEVSVSEIHDLYQSLSHNHNAQLSTADRDSVHQYFSDKVSADIGTQECHAASGQLDTSVPLIPEDVHDACAPTMSMEESRAALQLEIFSVTKTLRDLSVMIAVQRGVGDPDIASPPQPGNWRVVRSMSNDTIASWYWVSVQLADLERKPWNRIPYYAELDSAMYNHFVNTAHLHS